MTQSPAYFSRYLDENFPADRATPWSLSLLNSHGNMRSSVFKSSPSNDGDIAFKPSPGSDSAFKKSPKNDDNVRREDELSDGTVPRSSTIGESESDMFPAINTNSVVSSTPVKPMANQEYISKPALDITLASKEDLISRLVDEHPINTKNIALLKDHIKDMTSLVRRLSRDIDTCENSVSSNKAAVAALNARVSGMDYSAVAQNIDSRINRCDTGIKELVRELKENNRSLAKVKQALDTHASQQAERQAITEKRFSELERYIKKLDGEQHSQIRRLKDKTTELGTASIELEQGVSNDLKDFKEQCLRKLTEMVNDINVRVDKGLLEKQSHIERLDGLLAEEVRGVVKEINDLKAGQVKLRQALDNEIEHANKTHKNDIGRLRGECMDGFRTLQESIDTMHSILDSKIHLIEEQIHNEIKHAIKTIVVT